MEALGFRRAVFIKCRADWWDTERKLLPSLGGVGDELLGDAAEERLDWLNLEA